MRTGDLAMKSVRISSIDGTDLEAAIHPAMKAPRLGSIIQAHGIAMDMNEGGIFAPLAERLSTIGFDVLRFSYRGHGKSGGAQRAVTISGEMLDLQAALEFAASSLAQPLAIVAASFAAVSTCLSLPLIGNGLRGIALWGPVLDLKRTFTESVLPWGKRNFNDGGIKQLKSRGFLLLDGSFEIGRVLYEEMKWYSPYRYFVESSIPSIIVHGNKDRYVPYDVSVAACKQHKDCKFFTIEGSDHGFDNPERAHKAIDVTADWLRKLFNGQK